MSSKVLITGISSETSRNLLFQAAVHWAKEGCKVLYLSRTQFQSIPSTVHGPQIPSSEVLSKIRIVYLESMEELLKCIVDVLTFRDTVPRVIMVEDLQEYTTSPDSRDCDQKLARASATLCHVAACCAAHSGSPSHLLVTVATRADKLVPVVCSMFDNVWCFDSDNNTLTRTLPIDSSPLTQLSLAHRTDGALVLREITSLFFTN